MAELTWSRCEHGLTSYYDAEGRWKGGCEWHSGNPYSDPCDHLPDSLRSDLGLSVTYTRWFKDPDEAWAEVERLKQHMLDLRKGGVATKSDEYQEVKAIRDKLRRQLMDGPKVKSERIPVRRVRFGIETFATPAPSISEFSESLSTTPVSEHASCCGPTAEWTEARDAAAIEFIERELDSLDAAREVTATPPLKADRTQAKQIQEDRKVLARWIMKHPGESTEADEERLRSLKSGDWPQKHLAPTRRCEYPCDGTCCQQHVTLERPPGSDRHFGNVERVGRAIDAREEYDLQNERDEDDLTLREIVGRDRGRARRLELRKRDTDTNSERDVA